MAALVGSAYGQYGLDLSQLRRNVTEAKGLLTQLDRDATALTRARPVRLVDGAAAASSAKSVRDLAREADQALRRFETLERQVRRTADAEIAAARAAGDHTRALSLLDRELNAAATGSQRYFQIQQRIAQTQAQQARATPATTPAGGLSFNQALGAFGLATIGPQLVGQTINAGVQAGAEALSLRETQNSLRAVAGDYRTYAQVLQAARQQQLLFGGSLQENIEGLSGLTITARQSGASLTTLIDLSQRLAVLDPAQGAQGARIALSEALSGDPVSLARRFEIPRAELAKLRDTTLPVAERLQVISTYLDRVGVSSDSVAGKVDQSALAFRRLNAEMEAASITAGGRAADAFANTATGLSRLIGLINGNPAAIAELKAILAGRSSVTTADIERESEALAQQRARESINAGNARGAPLVAARLGGAEALNQVVAQIQQVQTAGGPAADSLNGLIASFNKGTTDGAAFRAQLAELARQTEQVGYQDAQAAAAAKDQADAQAAQSAAIADTIQKSQEQQLQLQRTTAIQEDLKKIAADVALGFYSQADASAYLEGKYPELAGRADLLIQQQARLASATELATARLREQAAQTRTLATADASSPGRRGAGDDAIADVVAQIQAQKDLAAAQRDQALALADTAGRVKILRQELAQLTPGTDAYVKKQTEVKLAERQLAEERDKSATKAAKAGAASLRSISTTQDSIENRLEDSYRRQLQLQQDYQLKAQRSQEDFDIRRSRSQEDFQRQYRRLLAEGKRFEAEQLKQEFERSQQREQEDFDRQRRRQQQDEQIRSTRELADAGVDTSRIADRAAIRGVNVGAGAAQQQVRQTATGQALVSQAAGAVTQPGGPAAGIGASRIRLDIQLQPTAIAVDGQTIATVTWPHIAQEVDATLTDQLIQVQVASTPRAAPSPLAGSRP